MSRTAIATKTRTANPFVSRLREELAQSKQRASSIMRKARESRVPRALLHTGEAVGTAAAIGAVKGALGTDEVFGVPLEPIAGVALIAAGIALDNEHPIAMAAGPLASYASGWTEDMVASYFADDGEE